MNTAPDQTLRAYVKAFETLDAAAVVPFYQLPCTFISPMGVVVASDAAAALAVVSNLIAHAQGQGYHRTDFRSLDVKMLGQHLAIVSGVFARFNAMAEEIGRFGFAYTMRRDGDKWKIVVAAAYEAPSEDGDQRRTL